MLVNKCRIYVEDNHARSSHYKSVSDKRSGNQNRENPYVVPDGKQKFAQKNNGGKSQSGGYAPAPLKCFKCGVLGYRVAECCTLVCFKCGKEGNRANECKNDVVTYFNCGEIGHIAYNVKSLRRLKM